MAAHPDQSPDLRQFRFLSVVMILFVVGILTANITAVKLVKLGPIVLAGGTLFFPLTYLFGDILTEIYGFSATRRTIWIGFGSLLFLTLATLLVQILPHPDFWQKQMQYEAILGVLWRVNGAGLIAYLSGEFFNSTLLAKLKIRAAESGADESGFHNRGMAFRFVLSTVVGQFVDSAVFILVAFYGVIPPEGLLVMFISSWSVKVVWEIIALPFTLPIVRWMKAIENKDAVDKSESLSPFHL